MGVIRTAMMLALAALALQACASSTPEAKLTGDVSDLLLDAYFVAEGASLPAIAQPELFELPAHYREELDRVVADSESEYDRYRMMRSWIYRRFRDYDFDITETYSIGQLNTNRKINCLSFSVMFVAAARYVGVPAEFQLVLAPPYWDREDNNWINNQHINVAGRVELDDSVSAIGFNPEQYNYALGIPGRIANGFRLADRAKATWRYTADINPAVLSITSGVRKIDEQQVLSLFFSNKAIEALLNKELGLAYAYTKEALSADPNSSIAWNNLGVLYSRVKQSELSAAAYRRAIEFDGNMYSAKSNLANNYRAAGLHLQAAFIEHDIESFRNRNPYYHSALAESSIADGDLKQAMAHLEEAVAQKRNEHFFYHQLAIVNQQLGDRDSVLENLDRARRYARGTEKIRFAGKLEALAALYAADD